MPSHNDNLMTWLISKNQTKGSIRDRQMAFLRSQPGAPTKGSFADLQKALGKTVREYLKTSDWP